MGITLVFEPGKVVTWEEFRNAGANISGFRERMRSNSRRVKPGDVFLCYLTGVMRWVGALEVIGDIVHQVRADLDAHSNHESRQRA